MFYFDSEICSQAVIAIGNKTCLNKTVSFYLKTEFTPLTQEINRIDMH